MSLGKGGSIVPPGVRVRVEERDGRPRAVVVRPPAGQTRDEPLLDAARWISEQTGFAWPAAPEACGHYACIWGQPGASWVLKLTFDPNDIRTLVLATRRRWPGFARVRYAFVLQPTPGHRPIFGAVLARYGTRAEHRRGFPGATFVDEAARLTPEQQKRLRVDSIAWYEGDSCSFYVRRGIPRGQLEVADTGAGTAAFFRDLEGLPRWDRIGQRPGGRSGVDPRGPVRRLASRGLGFRLHGGIELRRLDFEEGVVVRQVAPRRSD